MDRVNIVEDTDEGFALDIIVTNPECKTAMLAGLYNDIGQVIDVDTGQTVSGRYVSVTLCIISLSKVFAGLPKVWRTSVVVLGL